ncbi:MAG TPA: GlsB/YeaQ/YmgE family stress response membrane protein [Roseiflexaceae bacterium]|nr:GlsB/YeaQ/YmgE family stress response membrane protein [Roseiflexaceae bacterium]
MINFILWLLFGALVGWLASIVMRTDAQQGALMNIVVGIVGAFLGGLLFSLFGGSGVNINDNAFNLGSLLVSFIGAVVLLGIVNMFSRGRVR